MSGQISETKSREYHEANPKCFQRICERFIFLVENTKGRISMNQIALDLQNEALEWNIRSGTCTVHNAHRRFFAKLLVEEYPQHVARLLIGGRTSPGNVTDRKWMAGVRNDLQAVCRRKFQAIPDLQKREALTAEFNRDLENFLKQTRTFFHVATLAERNDTGERIPWTNVISACRVLGLDPPMTLASSLNMALARSRHSALVHLYHPDKNEGLPVAEQENRVVLFQAVQEAFALLRNWDALNKAVAPIES